MIETIVKRPSESKVYSMDFSDRLAAGETLASITSVVDTPSGDLSITGSVISGKNVNFNVSGGLDGNTYTIVVTVVTSLAATLTGDGELQVISVPSSAGMVCSYSSLLERVGRFAYGIREDFSDEQTTDIEEAIRDGLHDVYTAHSWSFFRPVKTITTTAPYATGTVTIAAGVVTLATGTWPTWAADGVLKIDSDYYEVSTRDSNSQITLEDTSVTQATAHAYELGRPEYDLPTAFEAIEGDLRYEPGASDFYPPITQKHDGEIQRLLQDDPDSNRPLYYSIRTVEFDPTVGSRRRLAFYPVPDAGYVIKARMKLRAVDIDSLNQYPVGAESLSQLITEACLAAAERNFDDLGGVHTKRFQDLLPLAIAADQEMTSPTSLGSDAPKGENSDLVSRSVMMGDVSINSVIM